MKIFQMDEVQNSNAKIKVIGVGGAGGNAVNSMIAASLEGVEFIVVNTDAQVLESSLAHRKLQIGSSMTKGLGAGANPEVGREAALADRSTIEEALTGADMVFITAGMGGGTGTGAAPVIAELTRELGILTVAVVTRPFLFEGGKRSKNADNGIKELKKHVDSIVLIHNNRIISVSEKDTPWHKALELSNDVLRQAVKSITDLIFVPGLINQDFADIRTILQNSGRTVMGIGTGTGEKRAEQAARMAINSPLLEETSINGAKSVLVNITGGTSLTIHEVNEVASFIKDVVHEDAEIIFGSVIDSDLENEIIATVIATNFEEQKQPTMSTYDTWRPAAVQGQALRGSGNILSKKIIPADDVDNIIYKKDDLDVPTFMRKSAADEEGEV
ncbi:MAG: cell division protein FtsZ [Thermodesulfovibrionia bacterium]|nr:cell division protein FtsZ [Thermodesulfovibrionia bacterium]